MRIHPNPEINAYLIQFAKEDGTVRVPKEAQEEFWNMVQNDISHWEDDPRLAPEQSESSDVTENKSQ